MPSYGFNFRPSARKGGGPGRLYLRVVCGGESRSVTTDYRIFPDEWDTSRRRLLIPYRRSMRGNELVEMENSMLADLHRMDAVVGELERGGEYTVEDMMERYRWVMTGNTLCAFAEKLAAETERSGCRRTAHAYCTAAHRLREFSGVKNLGFEHITPELLGDFQHSLKAAGRSMNTISFYMRTLRALYHKAVAEGRIARRSGNPFAGVYTGISTTRKLALTQGELATLSALDPTDKTNKTNSDRLPDHLEQALAMFLFCYHARGMCFVDMVNLKKSDIRGGTITYRRSKTGRAIEVKVLPVMRRIIDWFALRTPASNHIFPVIVDHHKNLRLQYESGLRLQNQRLKKIASLCGISKKLSTHCARHSWATVAKHAGLPLVVISEGLGHTNQRTTEIYLASLERSVIDHAAKVVSEAIIAPGRVQKMSRRSGVGSGGPPAADSPYGSFA